MTGFRNAPYGSPCFARCLRGFWVALGLLIVSCVSISTADAQMRALLPDKSEVPPGEPLPIDGVYTLAFNGAKYRFEAGRAYLVTPYTHLFVMQVTPGMVATKDIVRTGPGVYDGYDLPSLGPWRATLQPDGSIKVQIQGKFGPFSSVFAPVEIDDPDWLRAEIVEMQGGTPQTAGFGSRAGSRKTDSIYPPGWDAP